VSEWDHGLTMAEAVERASRRAGWEAGAQPDAYATTAAMVHARAFVFALDTIGKSLGELKKLTAGDDLVQLVAHRQKAMPDLVRVRDSAHHSEDRVQGKARERRIDPAPVETEALSTSGGVMVIGFLNGDRYGGTASDGTYSEVPVYEATSRDAADLVQEAHRMFDWTGPGYVWLS